MSIFLILNQVKIIANGIVSEGDSLVLAIKASGVEYTELTNLVITGGELTDVDLIFKGYPNLQTYNQKIYRSKFPPNTFLNHNEITNVSISTNYIGSFAFSGCPKLTNFEVKKNLDLEIMVSASAFQDTPLMTNFFLDEKMSISTIGERSFENSGLTKIDNNTFYITQIPPFAFANCLSLIFVSLPKVTLINECSFLNCPELISASFEGLKAIKSRSLSRLVKCERLNLGFAKEIDVEAFDDSLLVDVFCGGMTQINLHFAGMKSLTTIEFGALESIDDGAFDSCLSLTTVKTAENTQSFSVGAGAFKGCVKLRTIPNQISSIGTYAFSGCIALTELNLPKVVIIEERAFKNNDNLIKFSAPSCTTCALNVFQGCENLNILDLSGLTKIPPQAFFGLSISSFIGGKVTEIGDSAFENCANLATITFTDSKIAVGIRAFAGTGLTSINVPQFQVFKAEVFANCCQLKEAIFDTLETIEGDSTFANCSSLSTVKLGLLKNVPVTSLIFSNCSKLSTVEFSEIPPKTFNKDTFLGLHRIAFIGDDETKKVYDNDLSVDGDSAGDGKWCGIDLSVSPPTETETPTSITESSKEVITSYADPESASKMSKTTVIALAVSIPIGVFIIGVVLAVIFIVHKRRHNNYLLAPLVQSFT